MVTHDPEATAASPSDRNVHVTFRCPPDLLAQIDDQTDPETNRANVIRRLLRIALTPSAPVGTGVGMAGVVQPAKRPRPSASCKHPFSSRIGDGCAACGATGL